MATVSTPVWWLFTTACLTAAAASLAMAIVWIGGRGMDRLTDWWRNRG